MIGSRTFDFCTRRNVRKLGKFVAATGSQEGTHIARRTLISGRAMETRVSEVDIVGRFEFVV